MMDRINLRATLFTGDPRNRSYSERFLHHILEGMTRAGVDYLRFHPETPFLYESGVRYVSEPTKGDLPGVENFKDIPTTNRDKEGDCDDLGPWRAAELRARFNVFAHPFVVWLPDPLTGRTVYHIPVRWRDAQTGQFMYEDPSEVLGMNQVLAKEKQKFLADRYRHRRAR